jgi:hypothetical protein
MARQSKEEYIDFLWQLLYRHPGYIKSHWQKSLEREVVDVEDNLSKSPDPDELGFSPQGHSSQELTTVQEPLVAAAAQGAAIAQGAGTAQTGGNLV